ncbi:MAG: LTA synthase family protein [Propionibacteriaceae bacterium]|jgi:hypothetical protein|nr:LTA synthase family protein [Propionibacteriaceae bacterium]
MVRRRILLIVWCSVVASVGFPQVAYAYIDPATTSYVIQVVSALVITLSVTAGVLWNQIRTQLSTAKPRISVWFQRNFTAAGRSARQAESRSGRDGRDEVLDAELSQIVTAVLGGDGSKQTLRDKVWRDERSGWRRLGLAVVPCLSLPFILLVAGPLEAYGANFAALPFSVYLLLWTGLGVFALVGAVLLTIALLLRGRVFDVFISGLAGLALGSWVQQFLNISTGDFRGDQFAWNSHLGLILANTVLWVLIVSLPTALRVISKRVWNVGVILLPLAALFAGLVAGLSAVVPLTDSEATRAESRYLSYDGLTEVSNRKNIIVFLLDTLDQNDILDVLRDDPHFFDPLEGFTSFDQAMTRTTETFPSVPYMFTGSDYMWDHPRSEWYDKAWSESEFLPQLKALGYRVNVHTDRDFFYWDDDNIAGLVDNFGQSGLHVNRLEMLAGMSRLAAFSRAPLALQAGLWLDPDTFSELLRAESGAPQPYVFNDAYLNEYLHEHPVTVRETETGSADDTPQFSFIHLNGAHQPYTLTADGTRSSHTTSQLDQVKGSFAIVFYYIEQLKTMGLYDSSEIIILGDHGLHLGWDKRVLWMPILPALLVKPADAERAPLAHSLAPTTTGDLAASVVEAAGGDPEPFGTPFFSVPLDQPRTRRLYWIRHALDDSDTPFLGVFDVTGDARDFKNWTLIEKLPLGEKYRR